MKITRTFLDEITVDIPSNNWGPAEWEKDFAAQAGVDKCVTFEFSHFMSPYSMRPSAHNLYKGYCRHFGIDISSIFPKSSKNRKDAVSLAKV